MEPRVTTMEHVAAPIEPMLTLMNKGSSPLEALKALSFSKALPFHLPCYHILKKLAIIPLYSQGGVMHSAKLQSINPLASSVSTGFLSSQARGTSAIPKIRYQADHRADTNPTLAVNT